MPFNWTYNCEYAEFIAIHIYLWTGKLYFYWNSNLKTGIECCILGYVDVWLLGMPVKKGKKNQFFSGEYALFLTGLLTLKLTDF